MKNVLFVALLILLLACSKEDLGTVNARLGQKIRLKEGQAALYNNSGVGAVQVIRLKVMEVSDGRCPSDVFCVTYGKVEVKVRLETGTGIGKTMTMCLGDCYGSSHFEDEARAMVNAIPYKVRLLEVSPPPRLQDKTSHIDEVQLVLDRL